MRTRVLGALFLGLFAPVAGRADSAQDLMRRGVQQAREGKPQEGLATLRRAAQQDPSDAAVQISLGLVAQEAQRFEEARDALTRAVQLSPRSETALYNLAMIHEKRREWALARDAWQRFLALSPAPDLQAVARRHLERLQ